MFTLIPLNQGSLKGIAALLPVSGDYFLQWDSFNCCYRFTLLSRDGLVAYLLPGSMFYFHSKLLA